MVNVAFWCLLVITLDTDYGFGQSLSRLKNVTMSSQYQDWVGSRAVDGNYNRKATVCGCCAATSTTHDLVDQWMEIDLGETTEFNRIVVYGQNTELDRQNLIGLAIHLDDSKTSIASIEDTGQRYVNFYHFDLGQKYWARRIKLLHKGSNKVLVLCEVDVFIDSNISKGKDVTAISTHSTWTPSHAVDGNMRRDAGVCLCCAATKHQSNPWMKVDLGDEFMITYIQMYGRTDNQPTGQSFSGMTVSVDGVVIQTVPTSRTFISYYEVFLSPEKIGRNVEFTLKGNDRLITMCEVVIYGERVISYQRNATSSSDYYDSVASRAVDGGYRTDAWVFLYCTATEYQQDPWLRVDLGFEHRVSRVVIYGRTDGTYDGQNFAGMTISLDKTVVHTIPTVTNWINFYQHSLPSVRVARSVKLTLVGGDQMLVVCELLVYGDCREGYYGNTCATQCHCEGTPCHTLSGICPSGRCKPGYKTETCSKSCSPGKYGQNCAMECSGNCKDGRACNHVTGHCVECKPGYTNTDPFCNTRCTDGTFGYNCSQTCGKCRNDEICYSETGQCTECEDGYKYSDRLCKTGCDAGNYGTNCGKTCGHCRDGKTCNAVNGYCTGCADGYSVTDKTCKTECPSGQYGRNCGMQCGSCKNDEPCHHVNGMCADCKNGTYVYGTKLCNKACEGGTYGYNCTNHCGRCRDSTPCNGTDGRCVACEDGYTMTDSFCNTVCGQGTFGNNCNNECGHCFDNETCHHVNGSCSDCAPGYHGMLCTDRLVGVPPPGGSDTSDTLVIIGVTIPIVLIIVIVIAVVVVAMRRRQNNKKPQAGPSACTERLYANAAVVNEAVTIKPETKKEPVQAPDATKDNENYSFTNIVSGIPVHQLWRLIANNKGERFLNEFQTLKEGLLHPHNDALANRKKNRYREMFPYDHSRVHLKVERPGESEYINASHIDGFERRGKFIASQGPIAVMVVEFWRMVWQQNTTKIVMLTNLVEAGTNKCMQYWPQEDTVDYGRINITMVQEQKESDYSIRTLDIAQDDEPPRRVKQYHYKAWPDKDVPDSTWSLTQFWREVFRDEDKTPVVVHCSAGVGRTGTFIAMDNLYHQAITTGNVTPLKIVERLRYQRIKMVQTSDQYEFLHEAVADTLLFGTHYLWQSQYPGYYDFMMKKDQAIGGKVRLAHQFELLEKSLEGEKPRQGNLGDEYKPKASIGSREKTNEQGPIYLPSLGGSDSFILLSMSDTNMPTECLRLVDEHAVRTVITLLDNAKQCGSIWESIKGQCHDKYNPILVSSKTTGSVTERTFTYSKQTTMQSSEHNSKVKQIELVLSISVDPAKQAASMSRLFDVITEWHPYISTKDPVMIQCRDGITASGITATLLNEKLRMVKNGGQVHVLDSAMCIKRSKSSCISSYREYKFIHDILHHVLEKKAPASSNTMATGNEADGDDENIYQNM